MRLVARHAFDAERRTDENSSLDEDEKTLADVTLLYRQAYPDGDDSGPSIPSNVGDVRRQLGAGFVPDFADRLENRLGVDVVRVNGLRTDYCLVVEGRPIIVLAATPNRFRENFSLAHELGHLALAHHDAGDCGTNSAVERAANSFAAELLMPADSLQEIDWQSITPAQLARHVWEWGVSTEALATRLAGPFIWHRRSRPAHAWR